MPSFWGFQLIVVALLTSRFWTFNAVDAQFKFNFQSTANVVRVCMPELTKVPWLKYPNPIACALRHTHLVSMHWRGFLGLLRAGQGLEWGEVHELLRTFAAVS